MWIKRKTITYHVDNLPLDKDGILKIPDITMVRLVVPGYIYPVDVGSLCFSKRRRWCYDASSENTSIFEVESGSLMNNRIHVIKFFLQFLSNYVYMGSSKNSIRSIYYEFSSFVNWCDQKMPHGLDDQTLIREAYINYTEYLLERVKHNKIKHQTAAGLQRTVRLILSWVFKGVNDQIFEGVRIIKKRNSCISSIVPPDELDASRAVNLYKTLFEELSKFVINFEEYPIKLRVENENYWLFPNESPVILESSSQTKKNGGFIVYNFQLDRFKTVDEILQNVTNKKIRRAARSALKSAKKSIGTANSDKYHYRRLLVATLAQQCFTMLFIANTGMNLSQVKNLMWTSDDFETLIERQGFKTIKYRAGNKPVQFLITSDFLPTFKKYIKLREYLVEAHQGGAECLFFRSQRGVLKEINMNFSGNFNTRLKRLFNFKVKINPSAWRAYKSDWLIRNTDITTTSMILQNTTDTVIKHYITGSELTAALELTKYFDELNHKLILKSNEVHEPIALGKCTSTNNPKPIINIDDPRFTPNCLKQEGCLFCASYAVHADEEDIRKLISYKYLIEQSRVLSSSEHHFDNLYTPTLNRINFILDEISLYKKELTSVIKEITKEVYGHEALSYFWKKKLNMLVDLELL